MGIALLYGGAGSFALSALGFGVGTLSPIIALGLVLLLVSLGFKASAAPFHFWTPDVYDGSPTVFTSFMATVVKSAVFIAFLKLFDQAFGKMHDQWQLLVAIITAATMIIGNITAVFQQSVKRMLAYSSIAQAGFMMLAIFSLNTIARQGLILYAAGYSIASIGIFAVIAKMKDYSFEGFNGLAKKQPWVALSVTICLFSLAGIPLTVGFFSKYYMILGAIKTGSMFWLVILGILSAAVSVYYYFRVIQAMYFKESSIDQELNLGKGFKYMLLVNASLVVILGFKPGLLLQLLSI
ncbi:MAG: NADH-quinone oxidoreductase subunit N, partial [Chitinophagaceae bacterium]